MFQEVELPPELEEVLIGMVNEVATLRTSLTLISQVPIISGLFPRVSDYVRQLICQRVRPGGLWRIQSDPSESPPKPTQSFRICHQVAKIRRIF